LALFSPIIQPCCRAAADVIDYFLATFVYFIPSHFFPEVLFSYCQFPNDTQDGRLSETEILEAFAKQLLKIHITFNYYPPPEAIATSPVWTAKASQRSFSACIPLSTSGSSRSTEIFFNVSITVRQNQFFIKRRERDTQGNGGKTGSGSEFRSE